MDNDPKINSEAYTHYYLAIMDLHEKVRQWCGYLRPGSGGGIQPLIIRFVAWGALVGVWERHVPRRDLCRFTWVVAEVSAKRATYNG